jgi:hypothetical protein
MAYTIGEVWKRATGSTGILQNQIIVSGPGVTMVDTNTAQTLDGKTLTNTTITTATSTIRVAALAGLGTTIADAAPIVTAAPALILMTGGNNSVGVLLPIAAAGKMFKLKNDQTANAIMKVYPQVNSTINGLTANTSISMAANTCAEFIAYNATAWFSLPLLPS